MAHNPKLQVFRIELKPKARSKADSACFRDVLFNKLNIETSESDNFLWNSYLQSFVNHIDLNFFKDEKSKKAFTIYNEVEKDAISSSFEKKVLDGIIKGGKYDRERDKAKVGDKAKIEKIDKDDVILDQFYFLLYTPFDNTKGIEHIKPTIYLENRVKIDEKTGLPDFDELRDYSFDLLKDIIIEISKNETINEATVLS